MEEDEGEKISSEDEMDALIDKYVDSMAFSREVENFIKAMEAQEKAEGAVTDSGPAEGSHEAECVASIEEELAASRSRPINLDEEPSTSNQSSSELDLPSICSNCSVDKRDEEINEIREIFQSVNLSQLTFPANPQLTTLVHVLNGNLSNSEYDALFKELWPQVVGKIKLDDIIELIEVFMKNGQCLSQSRAIFRALDKDGTGLIAADKLKEILISCESSLSPDEIDELTAKYDIDENGMVNYEVYFKKLKEKEDEERSKPDQ